MPEKIITGENLKYQLVLRWKGNFGGRWFEIRQRVSNRHEVVFTAKEDSDIVSMIEFVDTINSEIIYAETQSASAEHYSEVAKIAENALNSIISDPRTQREIYDIAKKAMSNMNAEGFNPFSAQEKAK